MRIAIAAIAGALFAIGLLLSGMAAPEKVIHFLDVGGGHWDPSLAFVMAGAIAVHAPLARIIRARRGPLYAARFHDPSRTNIDRTLVIGSAIFGVGWGLSGYCPGPAFVGAAGLLPAAAVHCGAMVIGTAVTRIARRA